MRTNRFIPKGGVIIPISITLTLIIAWRSYLEAVSVKIMDVTSPLLGIPRYPFVVITAFGFLLLFLAALILFIKNVKSVKDINEPD